MEETRSNVICSVKICKGSAETDMEKQKSSKSSLYSEGGSNLELVLCSVLKDIREQIVTTQWLTNWKRSIYILTAKKEI